MKNTITFLVSAFCILLCLACTENTLDIEPSNDQKSETALDLKKANAQKMVTVPFKINFVGNYMEGTGPNSMCGDCPVDEEGRPIGPECWGFVINSGSGTGTHLGKFTHHFEFCCELISGIYPGPSNHMDAYFVSANKDTLFVRCAGQVINGRLSDHPEHVVSYFKDPFEILGGTGRFEDATGCGTTNDYNSSEDPYSHHNWTGTITFKKGKK